uniref:Putative secreted protein n=1 Tax=Panstrongylus lignarius TaxID=156445 RepID=A0A224XSB0_9HEMI
MRTLRIFQAMLPLDFLFLRASNGSRHQWPYNLSRLKNNNNNNNKQQEKVVRKCESHTRLFKLVFYSMGFLHYTVHVLSSCPLDL